MQDESLLKAFETKRMVVGSSLCKVSKQAYGQYFTPPAIAKFMASIFASDCQDDICLLDPGAGVGTLTAAFIDRLLSQENRPNIDVHAFEIDSRIIPELEDTLEACKFRYSNSRHKLKWKVFNSDFLLDSSVNYAASKDPFSDESPKYSHCIMNPPYKKLSNTSKQRKMLSSAGIEVVNLYSAFVALAIQNMKKGGQLIAIIPRSFCNGSYYRHFRQYILSRTSIRQIHLFDSRTDAFKEDQVLQENVIVHLEIGGKQSSVKISTSSDSIMNDLNSIDYPYDQIIVKRGKDEIIHIPTSQKIDLISESKKLHDGLFHLGIDVSTGPVVDFRLKEYLVDKPTRGSVPLLYPSHFTNKVMRWPNLDGKKPNALVLNRATKKWLYPNGYYTIVRRFSSKEEHRRIIPYVIHPESFQKYGMIGIENHFNVFHVNKSPLDKHIALGLATYLSSLAIDDSFRKFSGHTQVNASDLRFLRYPDRDVLFDLGKWIERNPNVSQTDIDRMVENFIL